jgi:hypothetical protein
VNKRRSILAWLALGGFWLIGFAVLEAHALLHPDDGVTLSRLIAETAMRFPLLIFLLGQISGGLAVHFFWHWDPANPSDNRG